MPKFIDYAGRKIGRVNVINLIEKRRGGTYWNCLCDCGNNFNSWNANFRRGDRFECKKCVFERKRGIDLTGRKFGRWTVLRRSLDSNNKTIWICKCDCGKIGNVNTYSLGRPGKSESCGCLGRKKRSKRITTLYPPSHGLSGERFYHTRASLLNKCYNDKNSSYKNFGAKGITICELWRNGMKDMFEWALENKWHKGDVVCLKDGKKEFNPENCIILSENDFRSHALSKTGWQVTYNGQTHSVLKWSKIMECDPCQLRRKLMQYPSIEMAFESGFKRNRFMRNPKLVDKIVKLYEEGNTQSQIAKMMKTHASNIKYYLDKREINVRKGDVNRHKRSDINDEEIIDLYTKGWSMNGIAKKLGCSMPTIKFRLQKLKDKNV